ncbi:MAG TPA: glycine cleavage system aminomethyltransferase GcvT [Acidimicrobiia bacterium]|jgi:aminomethyltransferase
MSTTPLAAMHEALGARFTDFGGWSMPLQYAGVLSEHMAVREHAGVFDVSHLGRFSVEGPGATEAVVAELCNDVRKIGVGQAQYTMALNEFGGVVDDVIVWRLAGDDHWLMPNGTNYEEVLGRFGAHAAVRVRPLRDDTVLLAVQGPAAGELVTGLLGGFPGRFRVEEGEYAGRRYRVAGTGYTGEPGAEIAIPAAAGAVLFEALVAGGAEACGLGARDTLRLEMGYPLWGQDLDEETTPLEAGLAWVVDWDHEFVGRAALMRQRDGALPKHLVSFRTEGRLIPRHGHRVRVGDAVGVVTSGNFSPVLGCGIGMGYVAGAGSSSGEAEVEAEVEIRGVWHPVTLVEPPFIDR